jgi:hypothetical protein
MEKGPHTSGITWFTVIVVSRLFVWHLTNISIKQVEINVLDIKMSGIQLHFIAICT